MTVAVLKIKEAKKPSGKFQGYRLVASVLNNSRYDVFSGQYIQSHAAKYVIRETLDYPTKPDADKVDKFIQTLKQWFKVDRITWDQSGDREFEDI